MSEQINRCNAFVFDLDGTLLDTLPDLVNVTNLALTEMGMPERDVEEIKSFVGNGLKTLLRRATDAQDDRLVDALFAKWQEVSAECGMQYTKPFLGVPEMLEGLRASRCSLAVVSNKVDPTCQMVIKHFFPDVFDAVHGECADYPRKPDPAGLLKTMREIGAEPSATAYVGDSPSDLVVAHAAGALPVGATWGYRPVSELKREHLGMLCDSPQELLATFEL